MFSVFDKESVAEGEVGGRLGSVDLEIAQFVEDVGGVAGEPEIPFSSAIDSLQKA